MLLYGYNLYVKTTVEINDELLLLAKRYAVDNRTTLRSLIERGLDLLLNKKADSRPRKKVKWVTADGPVPAIDFSNRERMYDWIEEVD